MSKIERLEDPFLVIAKASCAEVRTQLCIALDAGYLNQPSFDNLMSLATVTLRSISDSP